MVKVLREIKIIVCDDVKQDREELIQGIRAVWQEPVIEEAQSGQEVLWKLGKDRDYDFIFLDIYMDGMNGIETGRRIRDEYPEIHLVFVSSSREFGPEAFELNAVHYLLKPYKRQLLVEIRDRFQTSDESGISFYDSVSRQELMVPSKRILYIESARNYIYVHLATGAELKVRKSMQEVEEVLDRRFLRINRGVIVNMDAVDRMNRDSCEIDGMTFMLSRRQRTEYRRKYNDYIFSRYMDISGEGKRQQ